MIMLTAVKIFQVIADIPSGNWSKLKGGGGKKGCLKLWNALSPKFVGLGRWNFAIMFI